MPFNKHIWTFIGLALCWSCQQSSADLEGYASIAVFEGLEVHKDSLTLDAEKGLFLYNGEPFNGRSVQSFPNGSLAYEAEFRNGKKHGVLKKWFEDGALSYVANYKEGKLHGSSRTWWRNGNIRSESHFAMGIVDGIQKQWYVGGPIFKQLNYDMGVESGLQRAWRENGKLYSNYEAIDGRMFGLKRSNLCYELNDEEVQYKD